MWVVKIELDNHFATGGVQIRFLGVRRVEDDRGLVSGREQAARFADPVAALRTIALVETAVLPQSNKTLKITVEPA